MLLNNKLLHFLSAISCCYSIKLHEYLADSNLTPADNSDKSTDLTEYFFKYGYFSKIFKDQIEKSACDTPSLFSDEFGMTWTVCFSPIDHLPQHMFLLGPIFISESTQTRLCEMIQALNQPDEMRIVLINTFRSIPIMSIQELLRYTVMIHYLVTDQRISIDSIAHLYAPIKASEPSKQISTERLRAIYDCNNIITTAIQNADMDSQDISSALSTIDSIQCPTGLSSDVESGRQNTLILLASCCDAAISGDVPPVHAYDLREGFIKEIASCSNTISLSDLRLTMVEEYIRLVRRYRLNTSLSNSMQFCCDYIRAHVEETISLSMLANFCGYTEYYFSRKFKREVGLTPTEFINQAKVMRAMLLLKSTTETIESVSKKLHFSSRSYFSAVFMEIAGVSPSEYRKNSRRA